MVAAAWVQAIGSILAILAAVWIAHAQTRGTERQRVRRHQDAVALARELVASGDVRLSALVNSAMAKRTSLSVLDEIEVIALESAADALARIPIELLLPEHNARAAVIAENRLRIAADVLRRGGAELRPLNDSRLKREKTRELMAVLAKHLMAIREAHSAMDGGPPPPL